MNIPPPPPPIEDIPRTAHLCRECPPPTASSCRRYFGAFWLDKSSGGIGCNHPVIPPQTNSQTTSKIEPTPLKK